MMPVAMRDFPLTKDHEALLKAAYLKGDGLRSAWEACRGLIAGDRLDGPAYDLLPLLYPNLVRGGLRESGMEKIKGAYRKAWTISRRFVYTVASVAEALGKEGIKPVFTKDVALSCAGGFRPVLGADILVAPGQMPAAVRVTEALGWRRPAAPSRQSAPLPPVAVFEDQKRHRLRIGWRLSGVPASRHVLAGFLDRAVRAALEGVPVFVLSAADQLLVICALVLSEKKLIYLGDAAGIIRNCRETPDWKRFLRNAQGLPSAAGIGDFFQALRDQFGVVPPPEIFARLCAVSVSSPRAGGWRIPFVTALDLRRREYRRLCEAAGSRMTFAGFIGYLEDVLGVEGFWPLFRGAWARELKSFMPGRRRPVL